jgi:hypothetical protein
MTTEDILKIIFGAGLGLLISLLQTFLTSWRQKKKVEKLLLIELPAIDKFLTAMAGKKMMPTTELPNFRYFGVNDMVFLSASIASNVYQLENALQSAEVSRKIASGYLDKQNSPEFLVHSTLYASCIDSAFNEINAINEKLKFK